MSKKISAVLTAVACLASLPALADVNTIIGYDGLGEGGYALINPGMHATEASGIITLVPGTGASDSGTVTFHVAVGNSGRRRGTTELHVFASAAVRDNCGMAFSVAIHSVRKRSDHCKRYP